MELSQLKLNDKIKLELIQPHIKCSGRGDVKCYYRGKVSIVNKDIIGVIFKYKGKNIEALYSISRNEFYNEELKDIKIKI